MMTTNKAELRITGGNIGSDDSKVEGPEGDGEILNSTVEKLWPRRLLDTTTLISYEKQDGNVYGGIASPKYSTLSYTWGRFQIQDGPCLTVSNIPWQIPAIDPERFTATDFQRVIDQIRTKSGNRFLWLDIACIDEEDRAVKMEEVGRQGGIFSNADPWFIWLWTIPTAALQSSARAVVNVCVDWPTFYNLGPPGPPPEEARGFQANRALLERLRVSVDTLLDGYWFSSLWTLQEEGLQADAFILSREGKLVEIPEYVYCHLSDEAQWDSKLCNVTIFKVASGLRDTLAILECSRLQHVFQDPRVQDTIGHIQHRIRGLSILFRMVQILTFTLAELRSAQPPPRLTGFMVSWRFTTFVSARQ